MRILLVYPLIPDTFWSYRYALKFISKKALNPPLGLLTIAAMLPGEWEKKLIDMNVTDLVDADILWADYIFVSAMNVQRNSVMEVISRCNMLKRKIVAGGPLFTSEYEDFKGIDHFVLGEAEVTLPPFLSDLACGNAKPVYTSTERPDLTNTPLPLWSLINMNDYLTMNVQYSRGCPFDCEFCDIIFLFGRKPRIKTSAQVIRELDALYLQGWRGQVFIVDDNFIGNKIKVKNDILPAMIEWLESKGFPFNFTAELSIDLAEDDKLMQLMIQAGFNIVFIGLETPHEASLTECNKIQNKGRDMVSLVKKVHNHGLQVYGGFIVGFDSDPVSIFQTQIDFIQECGIVVAMVGLLNVGRGTRLYDRLKSENRLLKETTGDNTDFSLSFIPMMDPGTLIDGYQHVLDTIYSPGPYYDRIMNFFKEYHPQAKLRYRRKSSNLNWFMKSIWTLGVVENGRKYFWKLLFVSLFKYRPFLALSISFSIYRLHFYRIAHKPHEIPNLSH